MPLKRLRLEVTDRCPLRCSHCSVRAGPGGQGMMAHEQAESLIDQFAALGGRELTITGGEPLEYAGCGDAIQLGKRLGMRVTLFSMGVVGGAEIGITNLSEMPNEWVFSLHGATASRHEELTQVSGSFDSTVEAARRVAAAGVQTKVSFVATERNVSDLVELAHLCADIGIGEIRVLMIVPQGRGFKMQSTPAEASLLNAIDRAKEASGVVVRLGEAARAGLGLRNTCTAVDDELIVDWRGWISPCHSVEPTRSESLADNAFNMPLARLVFESPKLQACRSLATRVGSGCTQGCLARRALLEPVVRASIRS